MSIKRTCDLCGRDDIGRDYVGERLKTKVGPIQTEVMVAINGTWNSGDLCFTCLVAHFNTAFAAGENSEATA